MTLQETLLLAQGKAIAEQLYQHGYCVRHLPDADLIAWEVSNIASESWWLLAWLPRPVAQWRILPAQGSSEQRQIYRLIEQAIGGRQ